MDGRRRRLARLAPDQIHQLPSTAEWRLGKCHCDLQPTCQHTAEVPMKCSRRDAYFDSFRLEEPFSISCDIDIK